MLHVRAFPSRAPAEAALRALRRRAAVCAPGLARVAHCWAQPATGDAVAWLADASDAAADAAATAAAETAETASAAEAAATAATAAAGFGAWLVCAHVSVDDDARSSRCKPNPTIVLY